MALRSLGLLTLSGAGFCKRSVMGTALALLATPSLADTYHYRNLLIGDRAAGLGGAYVALSDDASGLFHNPAGAVDSTELASATVNVLSQTSVEYTDFFPDGGSLRSTSSGLVPSFFGILRHLDWGTIGFSIAVTDSLSERQLDEASFLVAATRINEYLSGDADVRQYNAGPSLSMRLTPEWALGVTLYGSYRDQRESRNVGGDATRGNGSSTDRLVVQTAYRLQDTQYGLRPLLGVGYTHRLFKVGATVARDFGVSRRYDYFYRSTRNQSSVAPDGTVTPVAIADIKGRTDSNQLQQHPWQLSFGVAFKPLPSWLVSTQLDHYSRVGQRTVPGDDDNSPPATRQLEKLTNFSLGAEFRPNQRFAVRAAVFTDRANGDVYDAGPYQRLESINLVGGALAGSYRDSVRQYKAGLYVTGGRGLATLGDLNELNFSGSQVVDANSRSLTLMFGAEL